MTVEIADDLSAVRENGTNMGMPRDVLVNHFESIDPNDRANSLCYKVAAALEDKAKEQVAAAKARADQAEADADARVRAAEDRARAAEAKAAEAEPYIPATTDEVEREALAELERYKKEKAVKQRKEQLIEEYEANNA